MSKLVKTRKDDNMENYLVHHGVLGQKKGNRRYQYEDGSLTPEGRRHYGVGPERKKGLDPETGSKIAGAAGAAGKNIGKAFGKLGRDTASQQYAAGVKYTTKNWTAEQFKQANEKDAQRDAYINRQTAKYQKYIDNKLNAIDTTSDIINSASQSVGNLSPMFMKEVYSGGDYKKMSNKELQDYITRVNLETQYIRLNTKTVETNVSKGLKITKNILEAAGGALAIAGGVIYLREAWRRS